MVTHRQRTRDEEEFNRAFDANGVIHPGIIHVKVPLHMIDSASDLRVRDGAPSTVGQRGFTAKDATAAKNIRDAYESYDAQIASQYTGVGSHGPLGPRLGAACTVKGGGGKYGVEGSPGHIRAIGDDLICCADGFEPKGAADHATVMDALYTEYDQKLADAWRAK